MGPSHLGSLFIHADFQGCLKVGLEVAEIFIKLGKGVGEFFFFFFFWPCPGILVPWLEIELAPSAVKAWGFLTIGPQGNSQVIFIIKKFSKQSAFGTGDLQALHSVRDWLPGPRRQ